MVERKVREIRRKTRRKCLAEEKVRIDLALKWWTPRKAFMMLEEVFIE